MRFTWLIAALLLPLPAWGFCRTWTCDPAVEDCPPDPLNPICSGGTEDDRPMIWNRRCVGFALNDVSASTLPGANARERYEAFERAARQAFESWERASCGGSQPSLRFTSLGRSTCRAIGYTREGANANLLVFRTNSWPYEADANALALTTVTANARTGEIYDADIEINGVPDLVSLTLDDTAPAYDLQSILVHEVGHFLGLAHTPDPKSVMFSDYQPGNIRRALTNDDREGVCTLYPADREVPSTCDPTPNGGYVSACAPNDVRGGCTMVAGSHHRAPGALLALCAGLLALSRRRRRRARPAACGR